MRPLPISKAEVEPTISILIAAHNEEAVIAEKLDSCLALDYPRAQVEVIVISDGSTDATAAIVSGYVKDGVIFEPHRERRGKSYVLNRAAEKATGEIMLVSDANAMFEPRALRTLVQNFADPTIGCVSGSRHLLSENGAVQQSAGLYWRYESAIKRWESITGSTMGVLGSMLAIRSANFRPIPRHIINDDFFLALCVLKQGQRVIYEPDAICGSYASQSIQQEKIRRRRISAGRFQHLFSSGSWMQLSVVVRFKLISHKYLRLCLLPFMVCTLLFNIAALWQSPNAVSLLMLLSGQSIFYLLALYGNLYARSRLFGRLPAVAYYIVSGSSASVEGLYGYFRGTETVLWHKANRSSGPNIPAPN